MRRIVASVGLLAIFLCSPHLLPMVGNKTSVYDFELLNIDGEKIAIKEFKGKVLLIVNVASKCGLTPQYKGLQELYRQFNKKGLVVLGFPANNFKNQEPGSDEDIKKFCTLNYGVKFPMFAKISVKGNDINPFYQYLIESSENPDFRGEIRWNFDKFLIDRSGKIINRFHPKVTPDDPKIIEAIKKALK